MARKRKGSYNPAQYSLFFDVIADNIEKVRAENAHDDEREAFGAVSLVKLLWWLREQTPASSASGKTALFPRSAGAYGLLLQSKPKMAPMSAPCFAGAQGHIPLGGG